MGEDDVFLLDAPLYARTLEKFGKTFFERVPAGIHLFGGRNVKLQRGVIYEIDTEMVVYGQHLLLQSGHISFSGNGRRT